MRTVADAENYLKSGPMASYGTHGFGLNMVLLKQQEIPIGMCGLVKRDELEYPDLGYAFLPEFWGKGFATEAGESILMDAVHTHQLKVVMAVTVPDNAPSSQVLIRLGFTLTGQIELYGLQNSLYEYRVN